MNKIIPFFSLEKQYKQNKIKIKNSIANVLDTQKFIGGSFVQDFEKNFSNYINSKFAVSCNSGTDALWIALKALDIQKNSIVITSPFSFISSSSEIVAHKSHPVFIDIEKDSYNIDPKKISSWINENTEFINNKLVHKNTNFPVVGIITIDIFGQCAGYEKIKSIADKYNLWIIEDACQAVGSIDESNKKAGTLGNISCFSFYPTKNLGAFGDGGCCTTNDESLFEKLICLRNHGRKSHYNYSMQGINSRLDGIQAAVLSEKLKFINKLNNSRRKIAKIYNEKLSKLNSIKLPKEINGFHTFHQFCIQIPKNRDLFAQYLKEEGIGTNIYYPKSLNQIEFLNIDKRLKTDCSISENLTQTILALPIWPELEIKEVEYICDIIKKVENKIFSQITFKNENISNEKFIIKNI